VRTGANLVSAVSEVFHILPDSNVGRCRVSSRWRLVKRWRSWFDTIARIMQSVADIQSTTASMDLTQAGWQRRSVEWFHQMQTLPIEIHQIELQILGAANAARSGAARAKQSTAADRRTQPKCCDFLRDKFTATDLFICSCKRKPQRSTARCTRWRIRAADEAQARVQLRARSHHAAIYPRRNMGEPARGSHGRRKRLDFALRAHGEGVSRRKHSRITN